MNKPKYEQLSWQAKTIERETEIGLEKIKPDLEILERQLRQRRYAMSKMRRNNLYKT